MKLVGATNYFIKGPFIAEGLLQGMIGGILSAASLWVLSEIIRGAFFAEILITHYIYIVLVTMGMILGLIGSYVSVNKYLT